MNNDGPPRREQWCIHRDGRIHENRQDRIRRCRGRCAAGFGLRQAISSCGTTAAARPLPRRRRGRPGHGPWDLHAHPLRRTAPVAGARLFACAGNARDVAAQPGAHVRSQRPPRKRRGAALRRRDLDGAEHQLRRLHRARSHRVRLAAAGRADHRRRRRRADLLQRPSAGLVRAARSPVPTLRARTGGRLLMSVEADVCVIGAGPAGLTAAYCLTKEMPSVLVIEKDPVYVGGISRTVTYKDFSFDIGGHRFFSKAKEVVDLWHEILPDDFIERPRLSRIYYDGKFYAYPLRAFEALGNLGLFTSAACMLSYACAKALPIREPRSFHDWVRNQFGERLFQIFFKTYTEKVWGMSCDEISADWAAQRIKGLDLRVAVLNALARSLKPATGASGGPVVKTLIESFQYPRMGPGMMWEAAARKIKARGGKVLMGRDMQ